ncbi:hypothetical protein A1OW_15690 [Enterovibrio norvegicus]|uniref:ImpB/mucB/samB family C-terminal domain-containing protein n=1 Tax=Enterovibrio norvegicus DSM 15893 TaxID=1121869 RepID=A0A1I5XNI2_9GAMM|nr:hypothetical protein [Enterovibrio norvegicus]OEF48425.1 hypothetical protein A1OW_15690 [Enterovibrio norvegicus]OEF57869.1 hypothetical protein A1OU_06565 [Enterovibrio norvegicus]SFQ33509.1 hypothetical protein SAMN03084138_04783 [Enterovibrio norvegicus DSM 15893]
MFRSVGDFENIAQVEFAKITIVVRNKYAPKFMQLREYGVPDDTLRNVGVTTRGRMTDEGCYLESMTLARAFFEYVRAQLRKHQDIEIFDIRIHVATSTQPGLESKRRKDSEEVRMVLKRALDKFNKSTQRATRRANNKRSNLPIVLPNRVL